MELNFSALILMVVVFVSDQILFEILIFKEHLIVGNHYDLVLLASKNFINNLITNYFLNVYFVVSFIFLKAKFVNRINQYRIRINIQKEALIYVFWRAICLWNTNTFFDYVHDVVDISSGLLLLLRAILYIICNNILNIFVIAHSLSVLNFNYISVEFSQEWKNFAIGVFAVIYDESCLKSVESSWFYID